MTRCSGFEIATAALLAGLAFLAAAPSAPAAEDPLDALYSRAGVALRSDERIFALYAAFNALGYDEAPIQRERPFVTRRLSPVRRVIRAELRLDPALAGRFESLFARAPLAIEAYARCALSLDEAFTDTADTESACGANLRELPALLRQTRASGRLPLLYAQAAWAARAQLKPHLPRLDAALERLKAALATPLWRDAASAPIAILNALDGHKALFIAGPTPAARGDLLVVGDFGEDLPFQIVRLIATSALRQVLDAPSASSPPTSSIDLDAWSRAFAAHALDLKGEALARVDPTQRLVPLMTAIDARSRSSTTPVALDAFLDIAEARPARP